MGKFIIVFVGNFAVTERIEIANLIIFVVKRSNMKRMSFLSVPYQNKMTKDFLYTPRHTVITSLRYVRFRRQHQAKRVNARAHHVKTCTYLRMKGMLKVIQSPAKYLQGPDASTLFGQYAKNLADSFFVIAGDAANLLI